jgi:deferrochelatase/peroxidase EfeB
LSYLERRFLRRSYPFFDGLDDQGRSLNGLHFIAFMKSIQQQFEHVVAGNGIDALYASGVLSTIDGGVLPG